MSFEYLYISFQVQLSMNNKCVVNHFLLRLFTRVSVSIQQFFYLSKSVKITSSLLLNVINAKDDWVESQTNREKEVYFYIRRGTPFKMA